MTLLRDYVARAQPRQEPELIIRFKTAPGWQGQVDFAEVKLPWGKRYAVLVVLGYSRKSYVEFVPRQTALTVMQSLERAFADFDGVPAEMLFGQLIAVIVEDQSLGSRHIRHHSLTPRCTKFSSTRRTSLR